MEQLIRTAWRSLSDFKFQVVGTKKSFGLVHLLASFKCRLCWRVALAVFFGIVVVEAVILIPLARDYERDLLVRLDHVGLATIRSGFLSNSHFKTRDLLIIGGALTRHSKIRGGALYKPDGSLLGTFGEALGLTLTDVEDAAKSSARRTGDDRYEVFWPMATTGLPYGVIGRLDAAWIRGEVNAFIWRIVGLVLLISAVVTSVTLMSVGRLVITPMLNLHRNLLAAGNDAAHPERYELRDARTDELGDIFAAFNGMLKHIARNIKDLRGREVALNHANQRLEFRIAERTDALTKNKARIRAVVDNVSDGIITIDKRGIIEMFNPAAARIFGYAATELIGENISILMPELRRSEHDVFVGSYLKTGKAKIIGAVREVVGRHKDGSTFPLELEVTEMRLGERRMFTVILRDITEMRRAQEQIESLTTFSSENPNPVMRVAGDGELLYANNASYEISGLLTGPARKTLNETLDKVVRESFNDAAHNEIDFVSGDHIYNFTIMPVEGASYVNVYGRDITKRKEAEQRIEHLAYYDQLTDLPNRTLLDDRLRQALAAARRRDEMLAVMFLDLDNFSEVNDTLGHAAGDEVLTAVAARVTTAVRTSDTVARLGGDEFAIIQTNVTDTDSASILAEKIMTAVNEPLAVAGQTLRITATIGIAFYPSDGKTVSELLQKADIALFEGKATGRESHRFFTPEMELELQDRIELEHELRQALERSEFLLHYQPQIEIATGRIVGVEALVRWQHPKRGMVSPAEFISAAETSGLIRPLGDWVLKAACLQVRAWQDEGWPLRVAVNLSGVQLQGSDLVGSVEGALEDAGIGPELLELEITETIMLRDDVDEVLARLSRLGTLISVDDFGTGYGSLTYLRRFPISKIKVDQSFIKTMMSNQDDAEIVRAVVGLGRSLNMLVIAEGVETEDQLAFLKEINCDEVQGYYFSPPLPPDQIDELLSQGKFPLVT